MKNHLFLQGCLALLIGLLTVQLANAQQMHMAMQDEPASAQKNIYLAMMDTMMAKMEAAPTGVSSGAGFIQQMIPHHEGAVEMARYEIQHGKDFKMIQLAKSILAEQTSEIQQMQIWLQQAPAETIVTAGGIAAGSKAPAGFGESMGETMMVMMQNMPANTKLTDIDHAFAKVMIPHHQAAIDMAKVLLKFTGNPSTTAFAKGLISAEQIEIEQMSSFLQ